MLVPLTVSVSVAEGTQPPPLRLLKEQRANRGTAVGGEKEAATACKAIHCQPGPGRAHSERIDRHKFGKLEDD